MADRSSAFRVAASALSPPTALAFIAAPGWPACSSASRCSGTLVGEVIVSAAPGTKLNPAITPPVVTVTSAVACCHHGFLTECTVPLPPFGGYSPELRWRLQPETGQAGQDRLPLRVARVVGVLEQHAGLRRHLRRGAAHPLLEDVAHQRRLPGRGADRLRAPRRVPRPGD